MPERRFDVIVVGGGHAGAEAAWAAAHLGAKVALTTFKRQAIGRMSCNPAIGGIGKGQIVREIDALGGLMGLVTDEAGIQFRMLNRRKGPAVWAPRAQADSQQYPATLRHHLENCPNLTIIEASVENISFHDNANGETAKRVTGVVLGSGDLLHAGAVIVSSGTFLRGLMHTGEHQTAGGRVGEPAAVGLSRALARLGLRLARLKTGTPPRVARDSVDLERLEIQEGDARPAPFSFMTDRIEVEQIPCWISYTNDQIHELIRANLDRAPMYSGQIQSLGPRYCPSIEDKIVRFADKPAHQIFLEPEGRDNQRIYLNGISTSLPEDVQAAIVARVPGLEQARVVQWGYAVEYDFVPPDQITAGLMAKDVGGLFLAGQLNGTSGYEEAAGQGLLAGVNAVRYLAKTDPVVLGRDQAYIGVMVDDLVTRGVTEPYRMFTSRAEHRLHLRYDNADSRLTPVGRDIGLVNGARWARFERKRARMHELLSLLGTRRLQGKTLVEHLKRPDVDGAAMVRAFPELAEFVAESDVWARALVEIKYAGYVARQARAIERFRELEERAIPTGIAYENVPHLRREAAEALQRVRPRNLGQAARVSGIHPSDVSVLMVYLKSREGFRSGIECPD